MSKKHSIAKTAEMLAKKKHKYEEMLDSTFPAERNTGRRMLDRINKSIDELFAKQEAQKMEASGGANAPGPMMGYGGKTKKYAPGGWIPSIMSPQASYVANNAANKIYDMNERTRAMLGLSPVASSPSGQSGPGFFQRAGAFLRNTLDDVNADQVVMNATPFAKIAASRRAIDNFRPVPAPRTQGSVDLDTDYNINPQLIENRRALRTMNETIDQSNTSSSAANAARLMAFTQNLNQTGQLYGQKENIETQLGNRQAMVNADIEGRNNQLLNQYDMMRRDDENQRDAMRLGATQDFFDTIQGLAMDRELKRADIERLRILTQQYDPGVISRMLGAAGLEKLADNLESAGDTELASTYRNLAQMYPEMVGEPETNAYGGKLKDFGYGGKLPVRKMYGGKVKKNSRRVVRSTRRQK